ncbi:carboxypeptidase-like regulatory domain-containing protein [Bremerella sp. JC817]|uniref:carboxypeptidase-like regulatory domain-containing protein n=1 Tax=Bremerella sp. JC817 TaxID=3231756 RepID=UPI0034581AC0
MERIASCLVLVAAIGFAGCGAHDGPALAPVSGKITVDGQPLVGATMEFYPQQVGAPSYGRSNEDGEFTLRYSNGQMGAVPGEHRVNVLGGHVKGKAEKKKNNDPNFQENPDRPRKGKPSRNDIPITIEPNAKEPIEIAL